jgi:hypothetical protein
MIIIPIIHHHLVQLQMMMGVQQRVPKPNNDKIGLLRRFSLHHLPVMQKYVMLPMHIKPLMLLPYSP